MRLSQISLKSTNRHPWRSSVWGSVFPPQAARVQSLLGAVRSHSEGKASADMSRDLCGRLQPSCLRPVVSATCSVASLNRRPPSPGPAASRIFSGGRRVRVPDLKELLRDYLGQPFAIYDSCFTTKIGGCRQVRPCGISLCSPAGAVPGPRAPPPICHCLPPHTELPVALGGTGPGIFPQRTRMSAEGTRAVL